MKIDLEKEKTAAKLRGSLQEFTRFFLKYLTQRDYIQSNPLGRESHQITICKELTKVLRLESPDSNLLINVQPGAGKTLQLCMWVAWCYAHYADCNFIYISYSHEVAASQTAFIKQLMSSPQYKYLFEIEIKRDSRAKDHFATTSGGEVGAFGSGGAITGRDAGLPGLKRFSGAVIIDDAHKPDQAHSDTIRQRVIKNYEETIRQRPRGPTVPIIYIGQRVHEDDLANFLLSGKDIKKWDKIILPALDEAGNALCPDLTSREYLEELREKSKYVFASQFQQNPMPAGGGIFNRKDIVQLEEYPDIQFTFITADTAETQKSYNDATVFSFWGAYEIETMGRKTGLRGLHWIDCWELRIEPRDLKETFLDFWQECNRFDPHPLLAAIEKKSTGVTLLSILKELRGIVIRDITRTHQSKNDRFVSCEAFVGNKQISINRDASHKEVCLNHISKITANNTHRFDDIADTLADAISIALVEKLVIPSHNDEEQEKRKMEKLREGLAKRSNVRRTNYEKYR